MLEFAFIATALMILTVGLADAGPAFFKYNALSSAARFGARWGSVVGGVCGFEGRTPPVGESTWCTQLGGNGSAYWAQDGNRPLQGLDVPCPTDFVDDMQSDPNASYFYSNAVGAGWPLTPFTSSSATTIVGTVITHFDTNSGSSNVIDGLVTPSFDLSKLRICLEELDNAQDPSARMSAGARVRVVVYYPYTVISGIFGTKTFHLIASSEYQVD